MGIIANVNLFEHDDIEASVAGYPCFYVCQLGISFGARTTTSFRGRGNFVTVYSLPPAEKRGRKNLIRYGCRKADEDMSRADKDHT